MPPLHYENVPPTPDDVSLEPSFVDALTHGDFDDMDIFVIAEEDAARFALDMERRPDGGRSLSEVQRGLRQAAEVLTGFQKDAYLNGVGHLINKVKTLKTLDDNEL
jgi:hypothetical protein